MAKHKTPLPLPDDAKEELVRRAKHLIATCGRLDHRATKMRGVDVTAFQNDKLFIMSDEIEFSVRFAGPPHPDGFRCYSLAYAYRFDDQNDSSMYDNGMSALEHMRELMVLDDIAGV